VNILVDYAFDDDQINHMRQLAQDHGGHQLHHTSDLDQLLALAPQLDVIMGHFSAPVCNAAPNLRWVQSFSAGMNNFLLPEVIERDEITVTNMAGIYAPQGGEHAWAFLLALARGLVSSLENMKTRRWGGATVVEITGSTLGIIGLGGFGLETLKRAQGYDMTVLALDPVRPEKPEGVAELKKPTRDNLHDLLRRSDAVVLACPRTEETYHLIGAEELAQMKNSAYLINVTRGGIIDELALVEALNTGQIAGAGLDVTEEEPLPADSPLWDAPNLVLTPHRAGASQHRPRKVFEFFCENLERYLKGEPLRNIVDKRKGY
jgi:phosphoglycerate dehydrogenase-like enzyme